MRLTDRTTAALDLVGPREIADRLGVARGTVRQWRWRGVMPAPLAIVSDVPVWHYPDIEVWYEARRERLGATRRPDASPPPATPAPPRRRTRRR